MFRNREDAAFLLAEKLEEYKNTDSVIVALPRGGVPMGYILATHLNLPLEIALTKKIGHPTNKEFAIGSISLRHELMNPDYPVESEYIKNEIETVKESLREKERLYNGHRHPVSFKRKNLIVVDDGIATGKTIEATIQLLELEKPASIILAIPVAPPSTAKRIERTVDKLICLSTPSNFIGVGQFYSDFEQVEDETVIRLLREADERNLSGRRGAA